MTWLHIELQYWQYGISINRIVITLYFIIDYYFPVKVLTTKSVLEDDCTTLVDDFAAVLYCL